MGLNLRRIDFPDWIIQTIPKKERPSLINFISNNIKGFDSNQYPYEGDNEYPRIGSYASYDIFRDCLHIANGGLIEITTNDRDDDEAWAINYFKKYLKIKPVKISYVDHILMTDDSDTIFLPVLFEKPFEFHDYSFGSSVGVIIALESFAKVLKFKFSEKEDRIESNPVITSKNIAKTIYHFLKEKPNVAVELC